MTATSTRRSRPRLLTIAGSDSGGGAGIQADLKTFVAHGGYGCSAVTAVTAQNTVEVSAVAVLEPALVVAQIEAVWSDLGVDGVKIGMLGDAAVARAVAASLRARLDDSGVPPPIVLDPVMVAKSGDRLLSDDAVQVLVDELLPLATVVTPNLPEARVLAGDDDATDPADLARAIARHASGVAVLLKGGHADDGDRVVDLLWLPDREGGAVHRFEHPRIETPNTHGTGCTLSSALAARLARGDGLVEATRGAIDYLHGAIRAAFALGRGHGPVDHLYCVEPCP